MAATTAELINLSTTDRNLTGRSDSLNSNSSALARRPRIRSRTRTLPEALAGQMALGLRNITLTWTYRLPLASHR